MIEQIHMRIVNKRERQVDICFFLSRLPPDRLAATAIHVLMHIMAHDNLNAEVLLSSDIFFVPGSFPGVIWIKSRTKSNLYKLLRS